MIINFFSIPKTPHKEQIKMIAAAKIQSKYEVNFAFSMTIFAESKDVGKKTDNL